MRERKSLGATMSKAKAEELIEELLSQYDPKDFEAAQALSTAEDLAEAQQLIRYLILFDMARALDVNPTDLDIEESDSTDDSYEIKLGRKEYVVVEKEEIAEEMARNRVREDLEREPEIFNQDFIARHINLAKLRIWVKEAEMEDEYWNDIAKDDPERFWEDAKRWDIDIPEPDEETGDMPSEVDDKYIEEIKEKTAEERSQDPMQWLQDLGFENPTEKAIEVAGIDIDGAVDEAISSDGWAHFISYYDGDYRETPRHHYVYWRTN
jgi:hypothetical protein